MQTVILPGHSPKNKEWVDIVANKLNTEGIVRPIYWDHWLDSEQLFYPKEKATMIYRHARGDTLNIVAHSVGTLVAAYIMHDVPTQINKVILCGIPLNDITEAEKMDIKNALTSFPKDKLVCYQNSNDPHATFLEVKSFLPEGVNLIEKSSTDHSYPYFDQFDRFLIS